VRRGIRRGPGGAPSGRPRPGGTRTRKKPGSWLPGKRVRPALADYPGFRRGGPPGGWTAGAPAPFPPLLRGPRHRRRDGDGRFAADAPAPGGGWGRLSRRRGATRARMCRPGRRWRGSYREWPACPLQEPRPGRRDGSGRSRRMHLHPAAVGAASPGGAVQRGPGWAGRVAADAAPAERMAGVAM